LDVDAKKNLSPYCFTFLKGTLKKIFIFNLTTISDIPTQVAVLLLLVTEVIKYKNEVAPNGIT
jgi:hypothetical protein